VKILDGILTALEAIVSLAAIALAALVIFYRA